MDCPNCGEKMKIKKMDVSYNNPDAKNKYYKRTVYHCEKDDIWLTAEIPTKEDSIA